MQWIINFFKSIASLIVALVNMIIDTFKSIIMLFGMIPNLIEYLGMIIDMLPSWIFVFIDIFIVITVIWAIRRAL